MTSTFKNVAVVGAGGNLGPFIVKALLKANFHVSAITRSTSSSTFPSGVHVVKGDYSPSFLSSAFKGIDAVVLAVGAGGFGEQKNLIDAAAKAGVKRLLPSEFGSDTANPTTVAAVPIFQSKVDIINYLKTTSAAHPGFTWTAVVTGAFYDWCLGLGFLGFNHSNHHATLWDQGHGRFETTALSTIGSAVAAILSHPEKYGNEYLYVNSFTTSQAEIFAALKKASGGKEWTVEERSADAYIQGGKEKWAKGEIEGVYDLIFGTTFKGGYGGEYSAIRKISNQELGIEEDNLEKVTAEVYQAAVASH
ncbi:hypothetical protein P7C71_g1626, partial [Lecanoromycetidae sp. Uapishka_2]